MSQYAWYKFYPPNTPHEIDMSGFRHLAHTLEETCHRFPRNKCLSCFGSTITFAQFDRIASQFAAFLQNDLKLERGDRLAVMLPNIFQFPVVFFAAQKIGVVCVNTNPMYTPREMAHQFKDSGAKAIVIIDLFANKLDEVIADTAIKHVVTTGVGDLLPLLKGLAISTVQHIKREIPRHNIPAISMRAALWRGRSGKYFSPNIDVDDVALLQYTGGTTGIAKGAMLTHRNILANMQQVRLWAQNHIDIGTEIVLTALPLYHIFALTCNMLTFMSMGHHLILIPKPIPIRNTVAAFKKFPITLVTGLNTLFNSMNNDSEFKAISPRGIKFALAGGMALQESVMNAWEQITGMRIIEGFGLTESSPVTHINPLDGKGRAGSIGLPLPSTVAAIVDDAGQEVPVGVAGELIISGPQVMKGYWKRDDETAKIIKNGWLYTGDIAKRDEDGFFYIVDRKKDMILVSGFNVYPNEIEAVLVTHPKVLEAAVIGVPDSHSGEAVQAYVVARDKSLAVDELKSYCRDQLTGYKRPRHIEIRESLPKSNVGKILRKELRKEILNIKPVRDPS